MIEEIGQEQVGRYIEYLIMYLEGVLSKCVRGSKTIHYKAVNEMNEVNSIEDRTQPNLPVEFPHISVHPFIRINKQNQLSCTSN